MHPGKTISDQRSGDPQPAAVDAVVWDYDGTLVDGRAADQAAVAELIRRDPGAAAGAELFWAAEGHPILQRLELAWPGRVEEVLPLFDRRTRPRVFPGIRAVLTELRRRGLPLAVVSSRRQEPLEWGLRATRLGGQFDTILGLESVAAPKPDPEGLLLACARLGTSPLHSVYIGDGEVDVEAGRRAQMIVWRATWALPLDRRAPCSAIEVRRPREVLERLDGLGEERGAARFAAAG